MRVVTSSEMRTIEEQAEALFGLDTGSLMERAGRAVAEEAERMLPNPGNILIICGKGNNGGDGFVAARLLYGSGYEVTIITLAEPEIYPSAAHAAFHRIPMRVSVLKDIAPSGLEDAISWADLIIDAIFGFSLKGAVRGPAVNAIDAINASNKPVISVDLPSGLEADTGKVHERGVKADVTVTFTAPKVGMLLYPGADYVGEFVVADIGIPAELVARNGSFRYLKWPDAFEIMPARKQDAHKKSVGQVLVVAGSYGMAGAAALTGRAAYRMGAGLVAFAPPRSITPVLNGSLIEAIIHPQAETQAGTFSQEALDGLLGLTNVYDVVAIGPGLTQEEETAQLIRELIPAIGKPLVIDADALNALVGATDILKKREHPTVITPHPGEMARLFGVTPKDVLDDWLGFAQRARDEFGVVTVLKGVRTVVCGPEETTVNMTGNPGLATAGTGDVLTGFIASLIAQGADTYDAASLGVYLHGLSADIAASEISEYCLMASDVIDYLPEAITLILG